MVNPVRNNFGSVDFTNDKALQEFVEKTPVEQLLPESIYSSKEFLNSKPFYYRVLKFCDMTKARVILNWLSSEQIVSNQSLYYAHNMAMIEMSERLPVFVEIVKYSRDHFLGTINPIRMLERNKDPSVTNYVHNALSKNIVDVLEVEKNLVLQTIAHLWDVTFDKQKAITECDRALDALVEADAKAKEQPMSQPSLSDLNNKI